jgi:hypothetical protein
MTRKRTYLGCICNIALGEHLETFGPKFDLSLSFFDSSFDLYYFWEVLHHGIFDQILDVKLIPFLGGKACLHDLVQHVTPDEGGRHIGRRAYQGREERFPSALRGV